MYTHLIVTRVDTQVAGHGKSTAQEEEGIEEIEDDHDKRIEDQIVLDRCGDQVEE